MNDTIDQRIRQSWTAEGGDAAHLPVKALRWLSERIGALNPTSAAPSLAVPVSALDDGARAELVALLCDENVLTTPEERLGMAGGLSPVLPRFAAPPRHGPAASA